jgi:hypothetical protein
MAAPPISVRAHFLRNLIKYMLGEQLIMKLGPQLANCEHPFTVMSLILLVVWLVYKKYTATTDLPLLQLIRDHGQSMEEDMGDKGVARETRAPRICTVVCQEAVMEFGYMTNRESNRVIIEKFIRKAMLEHGMRPSHVCAMLPIAVELYFAPTPALIMAAKVRKLVREERARGGLVNAGP